MWVSRVWVVLLATVLTAVDGLVAVFAFEAIARLLRDYRSWRSVAERRGLLDVARQRREETVATIDAVVALTAGEGTQAVEAPPAP